MTRRVLCLFYYFPPSGGAGAIRCASVARELPPLGWTPTVVAPEGNIHHTPGGDLALPSEVGVLRTGNLDLRRPFGLLRRLGVPEAVVARAAKALLVPDPQWGWAPFALAAAERALSDARFDALLTAGDPWTAHLLGLLLSRRHALPWVAMFADEWSTAVWTRPATPFHHRLCRRWEGRVLRRARTTCTTEGMRRRILAAHPSFRGGMALVDNGYDERDFRGVRGRPGDRFTLLYAGTLYRETAPRTLLKSLSLLLARRPGLASRIRLRMLGSHAPSFREEVRRAGLSGLASLEGPRTHAEALQAMADAHVLVDARPDQPNAAVQRPAKLFEYLRSGPPVLAWYPDGEASALLQRFPDCRRLAPGDAEGGARALEAWTDRWQAGSWAAPGPRPGIEGLSRAAQAARLAEVLDGAVRGGRVE